MPGLGDGPRSFFCHMVAGCRILGLRGPLAVAMSSPSLSSSPPPRSIIHFFLQTPPGPGPLLPGVPFPRTFMFFSHTPLFFFPKCSSSVRGLTSRRDNLFHPLFFSRLLLFYYRNFRSIDILRPFRLPPPLGAGCHPSASLSFPTGRPSGAQLAAGETPDL